MTVLYATTADLVTYLEPDPVPANADRLLARASEILDGALIGAVYKTDATTGMPTDTDVVDALRNATCAQVQFMAVVQDETGALAGFSSVSVGGVSYTTNTGSGSGPNRLAPQAVTVLQVAGLLPVAPYSY